MKALLIVSIVFALSGCSASIEDQAARMSNKAVCYNMGIMAVKGDLKAAEVFSIEANRREVDPDVCLYLFMKGVKGGSI